MFFFSGRRGKREGRSVIRSQRICESVNVTLNLKGELKIRENSYLVDGCQFNYIFYVTYPSNGRLIPTDRSEQGRNPHNDSKSGYIIGRRNN